MSEVKGYKVFDKDWKCRDMQYTCPGRFREDVDLSVCNRGLHFCVNAVDCFNYYDFNPDNHVAEIIAHGNIVTSGDKSCTDDIEIVREILWEEVLKIVNVGKANTGNCNTGNWNTGNRNTGNWNTGNRNTGDCNTGDRNTGNCNTGNRNTGNRNTGDCNTGDRNTGNCNTGDWNSTNYSNGVFNTEESKILIFNNPSDWSYNDWVSSNARYLLNQIPKSVVEWIYSENMTNEEKEEHPTHETTGGYLKILDESESAQIWWEGLSGEEKEIIKNIPNFDKEIFEKIVGIKMD